MYNAVIIEDDLAFAEIIMDALQADADFMIQDVLTNTTDARMKFEAGLLDDVDAVLVDLQLPISRIDSTIEPSGGLQLLDQMRLTHNFCGKIIVLTNSNSLVDGERAMRAGCDGYLCKCLRVSDLPPLLAELKLAISTDIVMLASEMRYVFLSSRQAPPVHTS